MTTTATPTPTQVEAARLKAEEMAARLASAEEARQERVDQALCVEARRRLEEDTPRLQSERDQAQQTLSDAMDKPDASLEDLWAAFVAYRTAGAVSHRATSLNAGNADQRLGMARNSIGVDRPRLGPTQDATAQVTFADVLERVAVNRAEAAVAAEVRRISDREAQVIVEAEGQA